jgi:hypothetical protein
LKEGGSARSVVRDSEEEKSDSESKEKNKVTVQEFGDGESDGDL